VRETLWLWKKGSVATEENMARAAGFLVGIAFIWCGGVCGTLGLLDGVPAVIERLRVERQKVSLLGSILQTIHALVGYVAGFALICLYAAFGVYIVRNPLYPYSRLVDLGDYPLLIQFGTWLMFLGSLSAIIMFAAYLSMMLRSRYHIDS
jgi:uncharacterized membrane protein HdeD (DUF308 family)